MNSVSSRPRPSARGEASSPRLKPAKAPMLRVLRIADGTALQHRRYCGVHGARAAGGTPGSRRGRGVGEFSGRIGDGAGLAGRCFRLGEALLEVRDTGLVIGAQGIDLLLDCGQFRIAGRLNIGGGAQGERHGQTKRFSAHNKLPWVEYAHPGAHKGATPARDMRIRSVSDSTRREERGQRRYVVGEHGIPAKRSWRRSHARGRPVR